MPDIVQINPVPFPPSIGMKLGVETVLQDTGPLSGKIINQYGSFTEKYNGIYQAWNHISNGKHYAQGFYIYDYDKNINTAYLYMDGVDFMAPLLSALSTGSKPVLSGDIKAIFMDIPLSVVKKL